MKKKLPVLPLIIFISNYMSAQPVNEFHFYVFSRRYNETEKQYIVSNSLFKAIDLIGGNVIDPRKEGIIDLENLKTQLIEYYPEKDANGILCLNIENRLFQNLKEYKKGTALYKESVKELSEMISMVKKFRPGIVVGIYGLPFRTYYPSQKTWNASNKLDPVLSLVDYISPSLYVLYPDKEKGTKANNSYWHKNLETAFVYADRLNKPVIPFVWYMVNPGNNKYGGELLGKEEMKRYLNYIKQFASKNHNHVKGVIWWQPSDLAFSKNVRQPSHLSTKEVELNKFDILVKYTQGLE
jgi:hypothetical protein